LVTELRVCVEVELTQLAEALSDDFHALVGDLGHPSQVENLYLLAALHERDDTGV